MAYIVFDGAFNSTHSSLAAELRDPAPTGSCDFSTDCKVKYKPAGDLESCQWPAGAARPCQQAIRCEPICTVRFSTDCASKPLLPLGLLGCSSVASSQAESAVNGIGHKCHKRNIVHKISKPLLQASNLLRVLWKNSKPWSDKKTAIFTYCSAVYHCNNTDFGSDVV